MVRWFRRRRRPVGSDNYQRLLAATAEALFDASVLTAAQISEGWPDKTGGDVLSDEKEWRIAVELVWLLIAAVCREMFTWERGGPQDRNTIQDDLVSVVINHMLSRMFDWSHEPPEKHAAQANMFLQWYNEAEMDYGHIISISPPRDHIAIENNLAGKWAIRVTKTTGHEGNVGLMLDLSLSAMRAYIAVNLPRVTVDLVQALHATCR